MVSHIGRGAGGVLVLALVVPLGCGTSGGEQASSPGTEILVSTRMRVELGENGRLRYTSDLAGNVIPDFSHAGYAGGGVRLPRLAVVRTLAPAPGDSRARIQAALDAAGSLPIDQNGFRGAVLLTAGTYEIGGSLAINKSGVVLRGEGQGEGGTVLRATGTSARDLIRIVGASGRSEVAGSRQRVTDTYVPVGTRQLDVEDGEAFRPSDLVVVVHETNQDWLDAIGADACGTVASQYDTADETGLTCLDNPWTPYTMSYERVVTAVDGNTLTLDVPLVHSLDARFGGGTVYRYTFPTRIEGCGVESIRAESDFVSDTDNSHALYLVSLTNVDNAWVRDVTAVHFAQGAVAVRAGSKRVTVQDAAVIDPVSEMTSGYRYAFNMVDCQLVLIMRCTSRNARHDFVSGSWVPGPNVFLDGSTEQSWADSGPHQRYATGTLYDNIVHRTAQRGQMLGIEQRGNTGSGQGWAGAQQLFWNCTSDEHKVEQAAPYFHNWSIGCRAPIVQSHPAGLGGFESFQFHVSPRSLYLKQLEDRLGPQAVENITTP